MKRFVLTFVCAVATLLFPCHRMFAGGDSASWRPHRAAEVLTYNVYLGADLGPVLAATTPDELAYAVARAWEQVQDSIIPKRARSIAEEIAADGPDLVGLQEVAKWSIGPAPDVTHVRYDFLRLILNSFPARGPHYRAVVVKKNFEASAPMDITANSKWVRLVDRDVILARIYDTAAELRLSNFQAHTFSTLLSFTSPVLGPITVPRSWLSVDGKVRDNKTFRFVTTHLEVYNPDIQVAQAQELISDLADRSMPVILAGDFNSNANRDVGDVTDTYPDLLKAGFHDIWTALHPGVPGDTCCQDAELSNPDSELYERIDLVLTRGRFRDSSVELVGAETIADSTPFWASDHAGVVAALKTPVHSYFPR
jgi:endonuclease/exonuclease/phosphatase family metal-dependent hydrolase